MADTTAPVTSPPATEAEADPRRWIALFVVMSASFMVLLDISIVNVAIPSIQSNLHASFGEVQLVLAGYALAYAVLLITGGRLGDIYGRKRLFMIGMAGFVVASVFQEFFQVANPERDMMDPSCSWMVRKKAGSHLHMDFPSRASLAHLIDMHGESLFFIDIFSGRTHSEHG